MSCSLIMWLWLMLCSATADLSGCASLICLLCCCLGVRYVWSRGGFIIGLGGLCCRFHGSSYLLRAVSIVLEDDGEKF